MALLRIPEKPGRLWYVVPLLLFAFVAIAEGVGFFVFVSGLSSRLQSIAVPGSVEMLLPKPGEYTIFHESPAVIDGQLFYSSDIEGLAFTIQSRESGETLTVGPAQQSITYHLHERSGQSVMQFEVKTPGVYRVSAFYDDGTGPRALFSIGHEIFGLVFRTVALFVVGFWIEVLVVLAVLVAVYRKRSRARATVP
jgi:hypothetical protein